MACEAKAILVGRIFNLIFFGDNSGEKIIWILVRGVQLGSCVITIPLSDNKLLTRENRLGRRSQILHLTADT